MQKVIVFFGTRPEAVKLAPVIQALVHSKNFHTIVCSTGQHKEVLQPVVDFFKIPVDIALDIMEPDQQLAGLTSKLLVAINEVLLKEQPNVIIVQGDTTTTFAASLAAFYNKIKILHVEAGLRTFNIHSPFPEEINRVFTSHLTDCHYAPTIQARENLLNEGVSPGKILVTGNTGIDALFLGLKKIEGSTPAIVTAHKFDKIKNYILVTMHRRESHGECIRNVCIAVKRIAEDACMNVIFPVHINPNIKKMIRDILGDHPLIHLTPPVDYPGFLWLMNNAYIILTDSSGVQEEAPSLGKPVLLLRDTTEHPEGLDAGVALKVGCDSQAVYEAAIRLLTDKVAYDAMVIKSNPYGDGFAAKRILESMLAMQSHERTGKLMTGTLAE